jgi:exosortase
MNLPALRAPAWASSPRLLLLALPAACLLWCYWPTFLDLAQTWNDNPQYSHGFLVPLFAAGLLWARRGRLDPEEVRPNLFLGLPLLLLGIGLRLLGAYYYYAWLEPVSLLPVLAGLCLLIGGWEAWRWAWPAILFLAFMVPLPYRLEIALSGPLQALATTVSTFLMQVLGLPALAEGTVIHLREKPINIVEACSGLRMLMVFFALSTAVALLSKRPLLDRLILVASAVPIALASNILRVTVTGILHETTSSEFADRFFHDVAGWLMMPLGLGMLGIEVWLLERLLVEGPQTARAGNVAPAPVAARRPATATNLPPARPSAGPARAVRARQAPPPAANPSASSVKVRDRAGRDKTPGRITAAKPAEPPAEPGDAPRSAEAAETAADKS